MIGVLDRRSRAAEDGTPAPRDHRPAGVLPACFLVMGIGVLLIALADNAGRHGSTAAGWITMYWVGEAVVFAPVVLRLVTHRVLAEREAIGLVLGVASATYLVKYLYSPLAFTFPDELAHWRTATAVLNSHHLFGVNYGLPISPLYPGLEEATSALATTTGLPLFVAGMVIGGLAHLVFAASLYLVFRRVGGSAWLAAVACMVYATNPHYQVFDAIFGYQTLALAFFGLVMVAVGPLTGWAARGGVRWWLTVIVLIAATVVTHHVTSYALAGTLLLLTAVAAVRWWRRHDPRAMGTTFQYLALAGLVVGLIAAWIEWVAPLTVSYLQPTAANFVGGLGRAITGHTVKNGATPPGPIADQFGDYAAAGLIMLAMPFGWYRIWRTQRHNCWAAALALGSVGYYVMVVLRLTTPDGAELAGRALTFLYVPVGFVLANALLWLLQAKFPGARRLAMARLAPFIAGLAAIALLFGGLAAGWPPYWERLPGLFVVDGFESGVTPQGVAAADWARGTLGPGHRIAADFTNYVLLGSYGDQNVVSDVDRLYCDPQWTTEDLELARSEGVGYLLVDLRTSVVKPAAAEGYFPDLSVTCPTPIPRADLLKFDAVPGVSRVYDSGDIIVYDLRAVSYAP